jgi:hypothetical protein
LCWTKIMMNNRFLYNLSLRIAFLHFLFIGGYSLFKVL